MIYLGENSHRIIGEIEKRRAKGQILHFLSGDAITGSDNFFYSLKYGICNLDQTLMLYYFKEHAEFDYLIHLVNTGEKFTCYSRTEQAETGCEEIEIGELLDRENPRQRRNALNRGRNRADRPTTTENNSNAQAAQQQAADATSNIEATDAIIERLGKVILAGKKRIILLLENMEWIANLYDQANTRWIAKLQDPQWQKSRNLLMIVTIKDMELLKKYSFAEEETYIGNPTAQEIELAYYRYLMRNMRDSYQIDYKALDVVAHSMSVGKKSLVQCMRVLNTVVQQNAEKLQVEDFKKCAEQNIEEQVHWVDVILASKIKDDIEKAVDTFLSDDPDKKARRGIILTGPPGTGKTMIAKALANEKHCYFMAPTLAELKGEYVGQTSGKVKRMFAEARGNQPTILFIDEADTVFPSRDLGASDRDSFGMDMVNQFLQEIDGAKTGTQKIFIIAATNRLFAIDQAVRSRLSDVPINIDLPAEDARRQLFNKSLAPFTLDGKAYLNDVLEKSEGMSGRDIDLMSKAIKEHVKHDISLITEEVFTEFFNYREAQFIEDSCNKGTFSRENIIVPAKNKKTYADVIGYDELKRQIDLQIQYITASTDMKNQYERFKITPGKSVLLYGPPGNAKTQLAESVAGEAGFYFFKILSQDFVSSYPDEQIKRLTNIFQNIEKFSKMMKAKGIVLFFDEFDSLAGKSVLHPSVRGTLLSYIADPQGIRNRYSKVLLMAATNFYGRIDDAIKRKGRFDVHLFMDNPSEENGRKILGRFFAKDIKKGLVEEVQPSLIEDIYNKLAEKVKTDPEKHNQLAEELFGSANLVDMLDARSQKIFKNKIKELRPSGADIKIQYDHLKEKAFVGKCFSADGKRLRINAELI